MRRNGGWWATERFESFVNSEGRLRVVEERLAEVMPGEKAAPA
jgi:hypothetical protein